MSRWTIGVINVIFYVINVKVNPFLKRKFDSPPSGIWFQKHKHSSDRNH